MSDVFREVTESDKYAAAAANLCWVCAFSLAGEICEYCAGLTPEQRVYLTELASTVYC